MRAREHARGATLALVVSVVVAAACGSTRQYAAPPSTASRGSVAPTSSSAARPSTSVAPPTEPLSAARDLALARQLTVAPADLPSGWTECCAPVVFRPAELATHMCGASSGLPARTAGYQRQYAENLTPDGLESAHLLSVAAVARSAAAASLELRGVSAPSYRACMIGEIESEIKDTTPALISMTTTFAHDHCIARVPCVIDRFVTHEDTSSGSSVQYTAVVRARMGRGLLRIDVRTYGTPSGINAINRLVAAVVARAGRAAGV